MIDVPNLVLSEAITPQIFRALRAAIVMLQLPPGQALSETEIARQFRRQPPAGARGVHQAR